MRSSVHDNLIIIIEMNSMYHARCVPVLVVMQVVIVQAVVVHVCTSLCDQECSKYEPAVFTVDGKLFYEY